MNNSEREDYLLQIQNKQKDYYSIHTKNTVFKNAQKNACANHIADSISLDQMMKCTVYIVPNTNKIYYNYLVFKTYGTEENAHLLYKHIIDVIHTILLTYDSFEFHINLKSFSVSACHRYHTMIAGSVDCNQIFTEKLSKLVIYNTPFIIDQITRLLYQSVKTFIHKTEYVREKSEERIAALFAEKTPFI